MYGLERTACKPSGFAEYDSMTGYVTRTYTTEWEDGSGTRWRKTCMVINLGRPDRGVPVDPDEMINTSEDIGAAASLSALAAMHAASREKSRRKHEAAEHRIRGYLLEHGPSRSSALAAYCGKETQWMKMHLVARENVLYVRFGTVGRSTRWGLVGVHDVTR